MMIEKNEISQFSSYDGLRDRVIHVISGGSEISGISHATAKKSIWNAKHGLEAAKPKCLLLGTNEISFTAKKKEKFLTPHHDALVILLTVANCLVKRILVYNGSSGNIIFQAAYKDLGLEESALTQRITPLIGFSGEVKQTSGQSTCQISLSYSAKGTLCPSAENTAAPPPAKEPEKMLTLHQGVLVFISSTHLEQRGVKEAREHIFPLLFIQKKKPSLWVPGSNFQVPDPGFQIFGCSPYKEVKSNDSTKNQTLTILLFLAMYLDILLKEAKATCFSRFPRLHVSKGNQRNLDIGPHPVYIESGSPSEDKERCRIKSIQPLGSRQQDKDSPLGKKTEFS
ncbi:hypothetical protein F2Q69_00006424 [Brassica cretica]|uniref:Uncharacterized protein n=1 Tax=Brassica cretica TaxID=69181 RepID=A0A8S9PK50_BRACR|nr:hypothetical protein F2Q69_00006424 [Brassica cretica]